jgi:hypothetical protein
MNMLYETVPSYRAFYPEVRTAGEAAKSYDPPQTGHDPLIKLDGEDLPGSRVSCKQDTVDAQNFATGTI